MHNHVYQGQGNEYRQMTQSYFNTNAKNTWHCGTSIANESTPVLLLVWLIPDTNPSYHEFAGSPGNRSPSVEWSLRSLNRNPPKAFLAEKDRGPPFWGRSLRTLSTMPCLGGHQPCLQLQAARGAEATTRTLSCLSVCCVEPSCIAIFMPGYVNLIPLIHDSHRASSMSGQRHRHGCGFSNRTLSP